MEKLVTASLIASAALSVFAATAHAAPPEAPIVLSLEHADFLAQLEEAAGTPGEVGAAASVAAGLFAAHATAEESTVLPYLGFTEAVAEEGALADLEAELPRLSDATTEVVSALVDLYAAADADGRPEIARLAERAIWHEMADIEVLYPAAVLAGSSALAGTAGAEAADDAGGPEPFDP